MPNVGVPTFDTLMNPVIQALKQLGGSGTIEEIDRKVAEIAGLSDAQLEVLHDPQKSSQTEIEYRLVWTRTYLKKYGLLENSGRGVWALTPKGLQLNRVDPRTIKRYVRDMDRQARAGNEPSEEHDRHCHRAKLARRATGHSARHGSRCL